jgi:hypothetical protein
VKPEPHLQNEKSSEIAAFFVSTGHILGRWIRLSDKRISHPPAPFMETPGLSVQNLQLRILFFPELKLFLIPNSDYRATVQTNFDVRLQFLLSLLSRHGGTDLFVVAAEDFPYGFTNEHKIW